MLTVPQAAQRLARDPETVRRWIRSGRLRARKVGTQHVIEEGDLEQAIADKAEIEIPEGWRTFSAGSPQPDWERIVRRSRDAH
jgi:excisionase family DNA binding protein